MRKIIVLSFITLDGVMQAPGGPDEDMSSGFKYGGWQAPYIDKDSGKFMQKLMKPSDLLLGRKTFDIFEGYWPQHADNWPGINDVTKYCVSKTKKSLTGKTLKSCVASPILKLSKNQKVLIFRFGGAAISFSIYLSTI